MERRNFLRWSGASFVSLSAYPWLAGCSENPGPDRTAQQNLELDPRRVVGLDFSASVARARSLGKPLLVFVAPRVGPPYDRNPRQWFADFFASSDTDCWRDFALCELACASVQEIKSAIPDSTVDASALLLVIEHETSGPIVATTMSSAVTDDFQWYHSEREWLQAQASRFAEWTATIHMAVARDGVALQRRAEAARLALGTELSAIVDASIHASSDPDSTLLSGAAAMFLEAAAKQPEKHGRFGDLVATNARQGVLTRGFSGAGWGRSNGCAGSSELTPRRTFKLPKIEIGTAVACGMGMINKYSDRFLWFYTDENR